MQQRGLTCTRRRHQRDRLSRPQRELGAVENGQCRFPLRVLSFYLVEIDDRYIFRPMIDPGEAPMVRRIAISLPLSFTSMIRPETIFSAATRTIMVRIRNITLRST